jgi:prepilin-type processing-associated H-X9-DG protein
MSKYQRPHDTLYLACFTNYTAQVHANMWYGATASNWSVAVAYDMHHASNVTGGVNTPQGTQRIAPKRHGRGANGVFLDGHAVLVDAREITTVSRWDDLDYRADGPPLGFP